ncbi:hypothetical protein D5086_022687 [Populus alba]|uniref:Uncharacterized protein n=1 Tax=Populus alba TaxID=43335 RepID=A0ACC4BH63_POPAL
MAESAVSLVIDKLAPLVAQGVQLLKGVHKEVVDIKDDLEAIRAFLKDADSKAEREGASEGVKVWVKQAREVAYQIEDVIDEYSTLHVAQHRDRRRVFAGFLTKVTSLVRKLPPRHKIASEIHGVRETLQRIKDRSEGFRSEELSFGHVSWNSSALEGIARHVSISKGGSDNPKGSTRSQTRSVMVFCGAKLQKPIIDAIFEKCKLLTALDFEKCPIDEIPKELGNLLHLKYLSLRDTLVSNLPKSIGKLQNLEFLDLSNSSVERLPVKVNRFPKLRYLLGRPKWAFGFFVRGSLGQLELLQKLSLINADGYGVAILDLQAMSSAPLHLQSLRLQGKLERLPEWISRLHNLAKLRLTFTMLMDGDWIKVLQALPNLSFLSFLCGYNGEKIHFEGGGFQKLMSLCLAGLTELNTMIIDQGAIPLLEKLEIDEFNERLSPNNGQDHWKVKHVPVLQYDGTYDPDDESSYGAWVEFSFGQLTKLA